MIIKINLGGTLYMNELTHLYMEVSITTIFWTNHTFENNFGMKQNFTTYLKKSCR